MKKVIIFILLLALVATLFWLLMDMNEDAAHPAGPADDRDAVTATDVDADPENIEPAVAETHTEETSDSEPTSEGRTSRAPSWSSTRRGTSTPRRAASSGSRFRA